MQKEEVQDAALDVAAVKDLVRGLSRDIPESAQIVSLVIASPEAAYECKFGRDGSLVILISQRKTFNDGE